MGKEKTRKSTKNSTTFPSCNKYTSLVLINVPVHSISLIDYLKTSLLGVGPGRSLPRIIEPARVGSRLKHASTRVSNGAAKKWSTKDKNGSEEIGRRAKVRSRSILFERLRARLENQRVLVAYKGLRAKIKSV